MTCIVGIVDKKGNVIIGGDSAGVAGLEITRRKDEKVFIKGNMIFGYTSSFRMGQLLRYSLTIPHHDPTKSDYEYMCTDFIEAVRQLFKDKGYSNIKENEESGGFFLVGYNGNLYDVECDFQVGMNYDNYDAVGCGDNFAKGVLFIRNKESETHQTVELALMAAAHHSAGVCEPFVILELKNKKEKK